jgi:hypothetical protein
MKHFLAITSSLLLLLILAAPAVLAQDGQAYTDHLLVSINGDLAVPAGDRVDDVIVVNGAALIEGDADTVTVVNGTATLRGATVETLTIVNGTANLEAGTTVSGDVIELNSTIARAEGATISGTTRSLAENLAGFALFLGFAAIVFWIGAIIAGLVAGLALAAFGARQVRTSEAIISAEPVKAFLAGLAMLIIPPLVVVLLAITLIGLPLALSILFFVWPTLAFIGYLVAAIWLGDWVLRTAGRRQVAERPYLASVVGMIVAGVLGLIPLVSAVISIFGLGAVTVAGWRTFTGGSTQRPSFQPTPAPVQG